MLLFLYNLSFTFSFQKTKEHWYKHNVSFQNIENYVFLLWCVYKIQRLDYFLSLCVVNPAVFQVLFIVDSKDKSAFCRHTGQNLICLSSATVASLEISSGKLKGKNINHVINWNSQFCNVCRCFITVEKLVRASNYICFCSDNYALWSI